MRRSMFAVLLAFVIGAATLLAPAATAVAGRQFTAILTGAAEVPGPGDLDAVGTAVIEVQPGNREVCYELDWANVDGTVTAAHIHAAPAGQAGPAVLTLFSEQSFSGTDGDSDCVSADRGVLKAIRKTPTDYYVNVHSDVFPAGAIRGQLAK